MKPKTSFTGNLWPFFKTTKAANRNPEQAEADEKAAYNLRIGMTFYMLTLLLFLILFCYGISMAQSPGTIGQNLPDIALNQIINYKTSTAKLADFAGKPLVMIFWNPACREAREQLEHYSRMQNLYKGKLQILAISKQAKETVLKAIKEKRDTRIPFITSDSTLKAYFPHELLPHAIWADKNGKIKAITAAEFADSIHLEQLLKNQELNLPHKADLLNYDNTKPLLGSAVQGTSTGYYSHVRPYLPGLSPDYGVNIDTSSGTIRTRVINFSVYKLYLMAFNRFLGIPENQVIWQVKDKGDYSYHKEQGYQDSWNRKNTYCYESILPLAISTEERLQKMQDDLNTFLGLKSRMEERNVAAWVLIKTGTLPVSKGGKAINTLYAKPANKTIRNASLKVLTHELNKYTANPPVVDETGYTGKVDIDLHIPSFTNLSALRKALQPYHLDIIEATRKINFLVMEEKEAKP